MDTVKDVTDYRDKFGSSALIENLVKNTRPFTQPVKNDVRVVQELPGIVNAQNLIDRSPPEPPQLIKGLLHQGSKMVLGGGSKSYKTWSLLDLGMSVATGQPWWGFDTAQAKVLYINLELADWSFKKRIDEITDARLELSELKNFDVWNLRGHAASFEQLRPKIVQRIGEGYGLIIIDPIYKVYGSRDENSAGEMGELLNEIERLAVESKAAVVFGAHFSKGNQAAKESIDRISGSGVFARDPDTILIMTKHEREDTFTVEPTLRNLKPISAFCVERVHPLMVRNEEINPTDLKKPGFKAKYTSQQLLDVLADQQLTTTHWRIATCNKTSMSERTFLDRYKELRTDAKIVQDDEGKWRRAPDSKFQQEETGAEVQQVQIAPTAA